MFKRIVILLGSFLVATAVLISIVQAGTAVSESDNSLYLPLITSPSQPPEIVFFTANVLIADPGDTITLSWEARYATTVTLYHIFGSVLSTFWDVEPSGEMSYTISTSSRNKEDFALFADNQDFPWVAAYLTIPLNCPFPWFFAPAPDVCPQDAALISASAEQEFEQGTMIWVKEEDLIYVLFADTMYTERYSIFTDEWDEGEPVDDPSIIPPPGLYQPQRGFGLVWREQPTVRERLGWALAPEAGGQTAVQRTSYFKYNHTYLKALDNNVWHLLPERSGWEKIVPDSIN